MSDETAPLSAVRVEPVVGRLTALDEACYANEAAEKELKELRDVLSKLVENNVTYWDNQGQVHHDVGTSQSEAMEIFKKARLLLTPNV